MMFPYRAVLSPCIGVCSIDDDGLCEGCHRTGDEIAAWPLMNDDATSIYEIILKDQRDASEQIASHEYLSGLADKLRNA